jgi:hypothetical protein
MATVKREMMRRPGVIDSRRLRSHLRSNRRTGRVSLPRPERLLVGVDMCVPEPILSMEDVAVVTRRITAVVNIPLIVDVGAAVYGEPAHAFHTIRGFEHAVLVGST